MSRLLITAAMAFLACSDVLAQEPAHSFAQLPMLIKTGDAVQVIDRGGRQIDGHVTDLSPEGIRVRGAAGEQQLTEQDVVLIRQPGTDSLLDGTLKGLAIGGGLGLLMELTCTSDSYCGEMQNGQALIGGLVWGTGIGLLVDALHKTPHDVYRARSGSQAIHVGPLVGRRRAGAVIALRW